MSNRSVHVYLYLKSFIINPNGRDGITKAVHGLAVGLVDCGLEVTVLAEGNQTAWFQTPEGYIYRCFLHETTSPSLRISEELTAFVQQSITANDVVILNGGFHLSVFAFSRLLQKQELPYIVAPHLNYDDQMFRKNFWLKYPYWYLFEAPMLNQALAVQMLDRRQTTILQQRGITRPVIEVQNGFEVRDIIREEDLTWKSRSDHPIKLFFLGRLSIHIKGLDLLLEAFSGLIRTWNMIPENSHEPLPQLLLKGSNVGENHKLLEQVKHLGLEAQVLMSEGDYTTPPTILMTEHDIVCLPSRSEGFGLVALEAMLAGRVLLVPAHAGIARHISASGCGVVVSPDIASIRAGLQWLLSCRSDWKKMGLQGRRYALEHLQWKQIAKDAMADYQSLLESAQIRSSSQAGSEKHENSSSDSLKSLPPNLKVDRRLHKV